MQYLKSFIGGFLSTLSFHQGVYTLIWLLGMAPRPPYPLAPTWPLGVPSVLSLAFWGGLWGIALWLCIRDSLGHRYWLRATGLGAIAPSAVALFIVFPIKGQPFAADWNASVIAGALLLNGFWGLGVGLWMRWTRAA